MISTTSAVLVAVALVTNWKVSPLVVLDAQISKFSANPTVFHADLYAILFKTISSFNVNINSFLNESVVLLPVSQYVSKFPSVILLTDTLSLNDPPVLVIFLNYPFWILYHKLLY